MRTGIPEQHLVRRYSLARLCNTTTRFYVDVAQLRALGRDGAQVMVLDARTDEDSTAAFLRVRPGQDS